MLVRATDGVQLYVEDTGQGVPVVFVHEFAANHRSWEHQVRYLSRGYRCITFSARGYPPSDVPESDHSYGQDISRSDVLAVMDACGVDRAHIVGHSMGAYTALHVGLFHPERCLSIAALGCGWGSSPAERDSAAAVCEDIATMFETQPMAVAAASYAAAPMRRTFAAKDARGFAEFEHMLSEHSGIGSALTMRNLQMKRPTLWELEDELKAFSLPLLVVVGDEDFPCLDGSLFLKRTVPQAALYVVPRAGHSIILEEPAVVNAALAELFSNVHGGSWMSHRKAGCA